MVSVRVGMVCDCCGKIDKVGLNTFSINHTLGYDSPMDLAVVTAAICDTCLLGILLVHVPGVVITHGGDTVPHEAVDVILRAHRRGDSLMV